MKERGITDGLTMNQLAERNAEHVATIAALAAENAGLKAAIDSTIGWQQSTDPVNVESVRMLVDIETPATDAFLAEVRAQGVERYAAQLKSEAELADETGWDGAAKFLISESEKVLAFAAQLRQEAAQ